MLHCVLLLDLLVHLDEVLLSLLLLVLFHEFFEHLLRRLLALLPDVLLDQLVHAAHLLLASGGTLGRTAAFVTRDGVLGQRICSFLSTLAFALATLPLV